MPQLAVAGAEGGCGAGRAERGLPAARAAESPRAHLVDHVGVVRATVAGAEARAAEDWVTVEGGAAAGGELARAGCGVAVVRRPVGVAGGGRGSAVAEEGALGAAGGAAALVDGVEVVGGLVQGTVERDSLAIAEGGAARAPFDEGAVRMAKVELVSEPVKLAVARFVWLPTRLAKRGDSGALMASAAQCEDCLVVQANQSFLTLITKYIEPCPGASDQASSCILTCTLGTITVDSTMKPILSVSIFRIKYLFFRI